MRRQLQDSRTSIYHFVIFINMGCGRYDKIFWIESFQIEIIRGKRKYIMYWNWNRQQMSYFEWKVRTKEGKLYQKQSQFFMIAGSDICGIDIWNNDSDNLIKTKSSHSLRKCWPRQPEAVPWHLLYRKPVLLQWQEQWTVCRP